ncbi:MAG: transglutaminase domain-containing protein [Thermoplasmata archaeon]
MSRRHIANIFLVLMALSIVMGAYSSLSMPAVAGFTESELQAPDSYSPPALPAMPSNIAGDTSARPDISVRILIGQIFAEYGGSVRIIIKNNDTRAIFLEELLFEWVGTGTNSSIVLNRRITSMDAYEVGALAVPSPPGTGLQEYQLRMRLLQFRNNQWYRMVSGGNDWLSFSEHSIDVMELAEQGDNPFVHNPRKYYAKTNELMDLSSPAVANATWAATAEMAAGYDMGKVCALFDWLVININYTEDPDGGDHWLSPDETLAAMTGDCEDFAMLLAAMVDNAGGTARVYLTRDHAFAAVYVGKNSSDLDDAAADIRAYYRTPVQMHYFSDGAGYWMVADPLGSFYMGGLAVGQVPYGLWNGSWNSTFPESSTLYSIDVTGLSLGYPIWLDPMLWTGMTLVFGFLTIGFMLSAQAERPATKTLCFICAGEIGEDLYRCPYCQTTYHRHCAFEGAYCRTCGKAIQYPAPPPAPRERNEF